MTIKTAATGQPENMLPPWFISSIWRTIFCAWSTFSKSVPICLVRVQTEWLLSRYRFPKNILMDLGKMRNFRWKLYVGKEFQHFKDLLFNMQQSVSGTRLFAVEYLRCWSADPWFNLWIWWCLADSAALPPSEPSPPCHAPNGFWILDGPGCPCSSASIQFKFRK